MKICAMKVMQLTVSFKGSMAISQKPKPCSINQSGLFAKFSAGGVNHWLTFFDGASGYLHRNIRKIGLLKDQKPTGAGGIN